MKSLKALEQKYRLINEVNAPVAVTPHAATPPAAPAAQPAPQPAAQPSILSAEELKKLNDPNSPLQPSKIEAIAKDPQQLKAFEQNELPGIIDGLVASIAQTNPEALKELHDAAKANDVNKVNELLLKYSQTAETAPQESVDLNTEAWEDVWNGIKEFASTIFNFFKQNSKLVYGALGLMIAGPLGAAALPLLATAIEKGNWGNGGGSERDSTNNVPAINKEVTDPAKWNQLKNRFSTVTASTGKKVKAISVGVVQNLAAEYGVALTSQETKKIAAGAPLNLLSPGESPDEPQFQLTGGNTGTYRLTIIKDGDLGGATITPTLSGADKTAKKAATFKAPPLDDPKSTTLTSSFNYNADKVLKEFHKNSKHLPIEVANKK
jgi:hypothetical protein